MNLGLIKISVNFYIFLFMRIAAYSSVLKHSLLHEAGTINSRTLNR